MQLDEPYKVADGGVTHRNLSLAGWTSRFDGRPSHRFVHGIQPILAAAEEHSCEKHPKHTASVPSVPINIVTAVRRRPLANGSTHCFKCSFREAAGAVLSARR